MDKICGLKLKNKQNFLSTFKLNWIFKGFLSCDILETNFYEEQIADLKTVPIFNLTLTFFLFSANSRFGALNSASLCFQK